MPSFGNNFYYMARLDTGYILIDIGGSKVGSMRLMFGIIATAALAGTVYPMDSHGQSSEGPIFWGGARAGMTDVELLALVPGSKMGFESGFEYISPKSMWRFKKEIAPGCVTRGEGYTVRDKAIPGKVRRLENLEMSGSCGADQIEASLRAKYGKPYSDTVKDISNTSYEGPTRIGKVVIENPTSTTDLSQEGDVVWYSSGVVIKLWRQIRAGAEDDLYKVTYAVGEPPNVNTNDF